MPACSLALPIPPETSTSPAVLPSLPHGSSLRICPWQPFLRYVSLASQTGSQSFSFLARSPYVCLMKPCVQSVCTVFHRLSRQYECPSQVRSRPLVSPCRENTRSGR